MKSDLSKFRMPKNTPLESKERVDVKKESESNTIEFYGRFKRQRFHVLKPQLIKKV